MSHLLRARSARNLKAFSRLAISLCFRTASPAHLPTALILRNLNALATKFMHNPGKVILARPANRDDLLSEVKTQLSL